MQMFVDQTKVVQRAREATEAARTNMLASFAQLQLNITATHQQNWDSISVRRLEDHIDEFKYACQQFRSAQDSIIKAMAMGSDRFDSAIPAPADLGKAVKRNPNGGSWEEALGINPDDPIAMVTVGADEVKVTEVPQAVPGLDR